MIERKIRVLVVEDSPTARELLVYAFDSTPDMRVVATAKDGQEALSAVLKAQPDVVTMDIHMPRMDGLDATRRIMRESPVPIVIISSTLDSEAAASFRALEAGALAFVPRPAGPNDPMHRRAITELVQTVRLMSEVKVVRRYTGMTPRAKLCAGEGLDQTHDIRIIAIGASTGGPPAILELINALPKPGIAPILIVQHMAVGFIESFGGWMKEATGHAVHVAAEGETTLPGHIYIAPDEHHMGIDRQGRLTLSKAAPEYGLRPAVSYLFRTVRETYGAGAAAVLLSGMGKDGAKELLDLKHAGSLTFAQNQDSALVFGMPGEAVKLNAARYVMEPTRIGAMLAAMTERPNHG